MQEKLTISVLAIAIGISTGSLAELPERHQDMLEGLLVGPSTDRGATRNAYGSAPGGPPTGRMYEPSYGGAPVGRPTGRMYEPAYGGVPVGRPTGLGAKHG